MDNMADLLLRVIDKRLSEIKIERSKLVQILSKLLMNMPYVLIEFKPAYGYIFQKYIPTKSYTHWGYSDFDVMFGDLPTWITKEELDYFDIVTYGYGDQSRVYIRGQFTFHKNNDKINSIWRSCEYLSALDDRLLRMIKHKRFQVQSAEGCYSHAVLERKDIKVKYASKAMTDVNEHNLENLNGVVLSTGNNGEKSIIFIPKNNQILKSPLSIEWSTGQNQTPQWEINDRILIKQTNNMKSRCMPWVPQNYQHGLCFEGIGSSENVFLIDGVLFKQRFLEWILPVDIHKTKALFHFQEWKRSFYSSHMLTFQGKSPKNGWVLNKDGGYALMPHSQLLSTSHVYRNHSSDQIKRKAITARYCLADSRKDKHLSLTCNYSVSWRDENVLSIVSEDWDDANPDDVTLILSADINSGSEIMDLLQNVLANFLIWNNAPVVMLIHLTGPLEHSSGILNTIRNASTRRSLYYIGVIVCEGERNINSSSLMDMAEDICQTRWTVTGLNFSRRLTLSKESSILARRMASIHKDTVGNTFIIPSIRVETSGSISFSDVQFSDVLHSTQDLKGCCKDKMASQEHVTETQIYQTWWKISKFLSNDFLTYDQEIYDEIVQEVVHIQTSLFASSNIDSLIQFQSPPIMMIDRKSPNLNCDVFSVIKDRVELPITCAHGLRLVKLSLLDYNILPLPGAFATFDRGAQECTKYDCLECNLNNITRVIYREEILFTAETFLYSYGEAMKR